MTREPIEVDDLDVVFGGKAMKILPPYREIPDEFHSGRNRFNKWASDWFFSGLIKVPKAVEGIDQEKAIRNLACALKSFEPKHEHKIAGVAFLASLWLEIPEAK